MPGHRAIGTLSVTDARLALGELDSQRVGAGDCQRDLLIGQDRESRRVALERGLQGRGLEDHPCIAHAGLSDVMGLELRRPPPACRRESSR